MSDVLEGKATDVGGVAGERLRSFVERIENIEAEEQGLKEDKKEIYLEAKGTGFDVRVLRILIRLRKKAKEERQEIEELTDLYKAAIGMD